MAIGIGIYALWLGEKVYVGKSTNLKLRRRNHLAALRSGKTHSVRLQSAWDVLDFQTECEFVVLETYDGDPLSFQRIDNWLCEREAHWMAHMFRLLGEAHVLNDHLPGGAAPRPKGWKGLHKGPTPFHP